MMKLKKLWRSKTIRFSLILAVLGVIEMNLNFLAQYMSAGVFGWVTIAIGAIVAILRVITTLPIDEK